MTVALRTEGLRKRYGRIVALDGLDIEIPEGVICGFIGPNGAGKTTAFGIVGGLIRPDAGSVDILEGGPLAAGTEPGVFSMLPQDCELVPHVAVIKYLAYLARLQGMSPDEARKTAEKRLDEVALSDRANSSVKELSHGMRRRVSVAQALLGDPKLVLLDEPTSGLDPELVIRMRELFASHRGDRTLVISSHNLRELEEVCDHVVFIQSGRCVRSGSVDEVTQRGMLMRYWVQQTFDLAPLQEKHAELSFRGEAASYRGGGNILVVEAPAGWSAAKINEAVVPELIAAEAGLIEIRQGQTLEAAYMEGQEGEAAAS